MLCSSFVSNANYIEMQTDMLGMFEGEVCFPFILHSSLAKNYFHLGHFSNDLQIKNKPNNQPRVIEVGESGVGAVRLLTKLHLES